MQARTVKALVVAGAVIGVGLLALSRALAHCDTMEGPVVKEAQAALDKGDVTPVLKWVAKEKEEDIRAAFKKTLAVRVKGPEARELADVYFFETLVRLHRAGEGEPYTGVKPAGTKVEPIVEKSDKALEAGSVDDLVKQVTAHVEKGIRERFDKAVEAKKRADESVEAGRKYVAAYVEYVHYVEGIHGAVMGQAGHHEEAGETPKIGHDH
jgi:hypothetical protein